MVIVGGDKGDWIAPMLPSIKAAIKDNFVERELMTFTAKFNRPDLQTLADLLRKGQVRSVIDRRYSLDEIGDAIRYSESGRARGKIIVKI